MLGDAPAPTDNITFKGLRSKHPSPPSDRPPMPISSSSAEAFQTTEAMVFDQIRHFPPGSSAGPDGLKPQHILEMTPQRTLDRSCCRPSQALSTSFYKENVRQNYAQSCLVAPSLPFGRRPVAFAQ